MRIDTICIAATMMALGLSAQALSRQDLPAAVLEAIESQSLPEEGLQEVMIEGEPYVVVTTDGEISAIRKPIFDEIIRQHNNQAILDYVEEAYANHRLGLGSDNYADVAFLSGDWSILDGANEEGTCSITIDNAQTATMAITTSAGECRLTFAVNYDILRPGASRSEIEQHFIKGLKKYAMYERRAPEFTIDDLEKVGDNVFVLSRGSYTIPNVNQNVYIAADPLGEAIIIDDPQAPALTIANMINAGTGYVAQVDLSVALHDYGKKEQLTVPLERLLQYCMSTGCDIYWGQGQVSDDKLQGTIFAYNPTQGYDHVIRITCDPRKLGEEDFTMEGRASLYVPTNNVTDLFKQYTPKSENERIKYK